MREPSATRAPRMSDPLTKPAPASLLLSDQVFRLMVESARELRHLHDRRTADPTWTDAELPGADARRAPLERLGGGVGPVETT